MDPTDFIRAHTHLIPPPLVPEVRLHLADEPYSMWKLTQEAAEDEELPPPFWAFAWAGGQALARYMLDHPEAVRGYRVLDVASGSGLAAIASAMAGATSVTATELDRFAAVAMALNAGANDVSFEIASQDVLDSDAAVYDVVLAGDVFYEKALAERMLPFLQRVHERGVCVLVGDPDRGYRPASGFKSLASYEVRTTRALEGVDRMTASVLQLE